MARRHFVIMAFVLAAVFVCAPAFGLGGERTLDLRNATSRMVWVTKSDHQNFDPNFVQWSYLDPGKIGIWTVREGGWLHFGYASESDKGKIERIISFQLPYHPDIRWIWKVVPGPTLEADWERL